jgi:hypothetical protein
MTTNSLENLESAWRWPTDPPYVDSRIALWSDDDDGIRRILARDLSERTRLIVEVGCGDGQWTRYAAECAPRAEIAAIDTLALEPQPTDSSRPSDAFVSRCWPLRERIFPLRVRSAFDGLQTIFDKGLTPQFVLLNSREGTIAAEIALCRALFPNAAIIGGGYLRGSVAEIVQSAKVRHQWELDTNGGGWVLSARRSRAAWPVDERTVTVRGPAAKYVTFFDPTPESGAWILAALAARIERLRPEISILIAAEDPARSLDQCGLDLRARKNVILGIAPAFDATRRWSETRLAVLPWLGWDVPATTAVEAAIHGVPVVASDRGALPLAVGGGGLILPLPGRIQPGTRWLPAAEEVGDWVDAIIRLWDDPKRLQSLGEAGRAHALRGAVGGTNQRFVRVPSLPSAGPRESVVLVPHLNGIEPKCEEGLRALERAGVTVVRMPGCSAIDGARNQMASDALNDGFDSLLFIDADIAFKPEEALDLLARQEPVVSGIYAKKNVRALTCEFHDGVAEVCFGEQAPGLYPLKYGGAGFLRIRAEVLRRMIDVLKLPRCNTAWGRGLWPFFQPMIVAHASGLPHYLGEDWSFCARLAEIGVTPLADLSIRLFHIGSHGFGWEDAGNPLPRFRTFRYRIGDGERSAASGGPTG